MGRFAAMAVVIALQQAPAPPVPFPRVPEGEPLKGIKAVSVEVDVSNQSAQCGITQEGLKLAAARPLLDGGIRVLDDQIAASASSDEVFLQLFGPKVVVAVNAVPIPGGCAASVTVRLMEKGAARLVHKNLPPGPTPIIDDPVAVELLIDDHLLSGAVADTVRRVEDSVRSQVDGFVTKIKLANQPK
jgi:hypothetical protein